jgi:hypothetical protein
MTKLFHIFMTLTLLLAVAIGNVGVYKCLKDGSLCMTKSCYLEESKCCEEDVCSEGSLDSESYSKADCCVDIDVKTDFMNDVFLSSSIDTEISSFVLFSYYKQFITHTNADQFEIRGPPPYTAFLFPSYSPIFKSNCSYLC